MKTLTLPVRYTLRVTLISLNAFVVAISSALAQTPSAIPPGVPEPGLIIWGSAVNTTNTSQQIQITSASWLVTDGTKTAVYTQSTKPPVQILAPAGQSYYALEVPFDTRRFGTITLSDPVVEGTDSFELKSSSPPTYTLTPTINGVLASVRLIDGAPGSGTTVPVSGFNAAVRGRVIRVDLAIIPVTETYEQWAARIFGSGSPDGAPGADPDHDGFSNAGEHAAGTDPRSAASSLQFLSISVAPTQTTLGWQSVADKQYVLEIATSLTGPWTDVSSVRASTSTTEASINRNPSDGKHFYRIRVLSP